MDIEQIKKVCLGYKKSINTRGYLVPKQHSLDEYSTYDGRYPHLLWMIEEIVSGKIDGEKAHRWLGFMQGVMWEDCQRTLEQLKTDNK